MTIIGAGAAGLFASGAAQMLGLTSPCLLIEKAEYIGGDCTNAACVPSKAMRSFVRSSEWQNKPLNGNDYYNDNITMIRECQQYVYETVRTVRERENLSKEKKNPSSLMDMIQVQDVWFVDSHTLNVTTTTSTSTSDKTDSTTTTAHHRLITSRTFLIATGAGPIVPPHLQHAADLANIHISTYQNLLRPEAAALAAANNSLWQQLASCYYCSSTTSSTAAATTTRMKNESSSLFRLLVAGGGATACELTQSLARLVAAANKNNINKYTQPIKLEIVLVAPAILPGEDVTLQNAAMRILLLPQQENDSVSVQWHVGRLVNILPDKSVQIRCCYNYNATTKTASTLVLPPVDALLLCLGRSPATSLASLRLENAGIEWDHTTGIRVHVHSLRSISARHVFAAGDCCNAIPARLRSASQAAWTGFHAVRNLKLPPWMLMLHGGTASAVQSNLPRVIYTE